WSSNAIQTEDEQRLIEQFGLVAVDDSLWAKVQEFQYFRRHIIFAHVNFETILNAIENVAPWAVMSGIKPTNPFHLGNFTTAAEIVEFQKMGAKAYYCIADIEAWEDNGTTYEESYEIAVDQLADILALGLDPDRAYIWQQSREPLVKDVPYKVSRKVTKAMLEAIYGEKEFGLYLAALVQVGDILLPQIREEPMPTVVPVGLDQAPHLRLTRDLSALYYKHFFKPSSTYHRLLPGIDGSEKMSKRNPNSMFTFSEDLDSIRAKIMRALTGGRGSAQEQREKGGEADKCMIFRMLLFLFEQDDTELNERYRKCYGGEILCGQCKKESAEIILNFIKVHQEKKENTLSIAREILEQQQ
ncbi:MAG TPA: tryptophan--tRNA ligase, partial [Candidatus Lokiarchaeia archaeon]|nr:tryptophan--tRNA ligase [Candidatus Lokiarchaeia archaeon]